MGHRLSHLALTPLHANSPSGLLNLITNPKDELRKFSQYAQSGGGVLPDKVAKIAGQVAPIALAFIPGVGPLIAAGVTAANSYANSGKLGPSVLQGGLSYVGGRLGSNLGQGQIAGSSGQALNVGNALGGLGTAAQSGAASLFGEGAGNAIGSGLAADLGSTIGSIAGSNIGSTAANALTAETEKTPSPFAYDPRQQQQSNIPASLQGFGGLDQNQQVSNIANKGVFGGGLGGDENQYFLNLINRQLVDNGGHTKDLNSLSPITSSYLQQLGLGGYKNTNELLRGISNWHS